MDEILKDKFTLIISDLEGTLKQNFPQSKNHISVENLITYLDEFHKSDYDLDRYFNSNSKKDYILDLYTNFPNKFSGEKIPYLNNLTYDLAQKIPIYDVINGQRINY